MREPLLKKVVDEDLSPIVPAIQWAMTAGLENALSQYDPVSGHDQWVLGCLAYNQINDKVDRVFATGKYRSSGEAVAPALEADVLYGLPEAVINTMPTIEPGLVSRGLVEQTPCLRYREYALLTQSTGDAPLDDFRWETLKKKTKTKIASLEYGDAALTGEQLTFSLGLDRLPSNRFIMIAYRITKSGFETGYGVARNNSAGGPPWYWFTPLAPFEFEVHDELPELAAGTKPRLNRNVSLKRPGSNHRPSDGTY